MKKKTFLITLFSSIIIFSSYFIIQPMGNIFNNLNHNDFTPHPHPLSTPTQRLNLNNGVFYFHTNSKFASTGALRFKENSRIHLSLKSQSTESDNSIEYRIYKNKKIIYKSVITTSEEILLPINRGDRVEIHARKINGIDYKWGRISAKINEDFFRVKNVIIPLLWTIVLTVLTLRNCAPIAITGYLVFTLLITAEKLTYGALRFNTTLMYLIISLLLTTIFGIISKSFHGVKKLNITAGLIFTLAMATCAIPAIIIIYTLNNQQKISEEVIYAIAQTNQSEALEYISSSISSNTLIVTAILVIFIAALAVKQSTLKAPNIRTPLLIATALLLSAFTYHSKDTFPLPKFLASSLLNYQKELDLFKQTQKNRKISDIEFTSTKTRKNETHIIILGESLNKRHMGVYGYTRKTTPALSRLKENGEILLFDNTYSSHTHTAPTMKLALTEANQVNKKPFHQSLSIINILKQANIDTHWITNQQLKGVWDNAVSVLAAEADNIVSINRSIGKQTKTKEHDGALLPELEKVLTNNSGNNKVIFIHLMGNHGIYCLRYPAAEFTKYQDPVSAFEYGQIANIKELSPHINCYDNSVNYNDYVVGSIIDQLKKNDGVTSAIYLSDHADDIFTGRRHNSQKFTFEMTQIPMIVWLSDKYKDTYPETAENLKRRISSLYSNDFLYDTIIGITSVNTNKYDKTFDLSSNGYRFNEDQAFTLHGKKRYTGPDNHIFWQKKNTAKLIKQGIKSRVYPHRVNSIGKLQDIWRDGFRAFEVDIQISKEKNSLRVGHDINLVTGSLSTMLSSIDHTKAERIWLDIKNLNEKNFYTALELLESIDSIFNIKDKIIIESNIKSSLFKKFRARGWHTSYYLPTAKILTLIQAQDSVELNRLAVDIAKQLTHQDIAAVSFDQRLYIFVKYFLEEKINENIDYHTWFGPSIFDSKFEEKLIKSDVHNDTRVKSILSRYKSNFDI